MKGVRSNGMETRSRHGAVAWSRTRTTVRSSAATNAVAARTTKSRSTVHELTSPGFCASSDVAPLSRFTRCTSNTLRSRRFISTSTSAGRFASTKNPCARTPRNGVRSRTFPVASSAA